MSKIAKIFGLDAPSMPAPAPPPPTRQSPEVGAAGDASRADALRRKGRRRAVLTSPEGLDDDLGAGTSIQRPQARAAQLGG